MPSLIFSALSVVNLLSFVHAIKVTVPLSAKNAGPSVLEAFVSYSIEFAFFPDYAGNTTVPNVFSDNLLNNIAAFQGTKPYIRVGGNTQDYALYNASLTTATYGVYNPGRSVDYPTTLYIGPSFFDSYSTWPETKFVHGFNLALGVTTPQGYQTLKETIPLACKALSDGRLLLWEYGNEPDLYTATPWDEAIYVAQWKNGSRTIQAGLEQACPQLATKKNYGYYAPSFAGTNNKLKAVKAWNSGLNEDADVKIFSMHNYIGGATQPGVTLQGTLMNHTRTVDSISSQLATLRGLQASTYQSFSIPYVLGESNSLYNEGAPGLSNSFGAALWGVDFNLWCASQGIRRVHMHQGTDYRYASWQPVATTKTSIGTKAPYYGNIAVAAFLGDHTDDDVQILNLPLPNSYEAVYARYAGGHLTKMAIINMRSYNYTLGGVSSTLNPARRGTLAYNFSLPPGSNGSAGTQYLWANGSDAISGITYDGMSYNYELDMGKPVRLMNVTIGETIAIVNETINLNVPDSSALFLSF